MEKNRTRQESNPKPSDPWFVKRRSPNVRRKRVPHTNVRRMNDPRTNRMNMRLTHTNCGVYDARRQAFRDPR